MTGGLHLIVTPAHQQSRVSRFAKAIGADFAAARGINKRIFKDRE
jgi:hypothetical protein